MSRHSAEVVPSGEPASGHDGADAKAVTAARWAAVLAATAYTPLSRAELIRLLEKLVDELADALLAEPFSACRAEQVGVALVEAGFTTPDALRVTYTALARPLVEFAGAAGATDPVGQMVALLGAAAAGYTGTLREWLATEQERVNRALLIASGDIKGRTPHDEQPLREMFNRAPMGFAVSAADGKLVHVNPKLGELLGVRPDALVGRGLAEFIHPEDADDVDESSADDYRDLFERVGHRLRKRHRLIREDGQVCWVYLSESPLGESDDDRTAGSRLTLVEDVSELHLLQNHLSNQALHDGLTFLPNRQFLLNRLRNLLNDQYEQAKGCRVALYHVDIDGFSTIIRGLGPVAADRVLIEVARRLERQFGTNGAFVARISGDEFAVLTWVDGDASDVLGTIELINEALADPVYLPTEQLDVPISASVGVAPALAGGTDAMELTRQAAVALRRAQSIGKRQWAVYDSDHDRDDRRRLLLAASLPAALEFGELTVNWQPWTAFGAHRLGGIAARLTWAHPQRGTIPHAQCLDLAEEFGSGQSISEWLVRTACQQASEWRHRFGAAVPPIDIGLSATQAGDPDLVRKVRDALLEHGLGPEAVRLGFPTSALTAEDGEARGNFDVVFAMNLPVMLIGVGASITDVTYVEASPVSVVELAPTLVQQVAAKPGSFTARFATELTQLASASGATVIVPGVPTEQQAQWWRAAGANAVAEDSTLTADGVAELLRTQ